MHRSSPMILLSLLLFACGDKDSGDDGDGGATTDADSDGFASGVDCDDSDASINPEATEVCDGVDNDCDDLVDDEDSDVDTTGGSTWYADGDFDGFGDAAAGTVSCSQPAGYVADDSDCDDGDDAVNPDADEQCNGIDDDCDDSIDEGAEGLSTWYADADEDGYGDETTAVEACAAPPDHVEVGGDCDDSAGAVFPGATELCNQIDDDCDPLTTEAGTAAFETTDGTWEDWTGDFDGGSARAAYIAVEDPGTLHLCEGAWYATVDVFADLAVTGHADSREAVVLDAAADGVALEVGADAVSLSASDLTIRNGLGETSSSFGTGAGGVGCETTDSSVTLTNVLLKGNLGGYGGAVGTYGCTLSISDSLVTGNEAEVGAGVSVWGADATLEDTRVEDNAAVDATGVLLYGEGTNSYALAEVTLRGNSSTYSAAGLYLTGGDAEIRGGSIVANSGNYTAGGASLYLDADQTATFTEVDFGTVEGDDDNSPYDLDSSDLPYTAGDAATFTCTEDGCGRAVSSRVGGDSSYVTMSATAYGSMITAEADVTLSALDFQAWSEEGCTADAYVLSRDVDDLWLVEWSATDVTLGTSSSWTTVGNPNLLLDAGTDYAFVLAAVCDRGSVRWSYDSTGSDISAEFGSSSAYVYPASYSRPWSTSVSLNESTTATLSFTTRFETTEL